MATSRKKPRAPEQDLRLRIVVVKPPPSVQWAVQLGKDFLLASKRATVDLVEFEFAIRVAGKTASGAPRFLGLAVQGPPDARFVYVNSGKHAGDLNSCWDRRAKAPLTGIGSALIAKATEKPGCMLEARIGGRARDGGPACGTVKLLGTGWSITRE